MESTSVIEGLQIIEKCSVGRLASWKAMLWGKRLVFDRGKGAFSEGVIIAVSLGAHALLKAEVGQEGSDLRGGVLAAPIGVKDRSFCNESSGDSPGKGVGHQSALHGI